MILSQHQQPLRQTLSGAYWLLLGVTGWKSCRTSPIGHAFLSKLNSWWAEDISCMGSQQWTAIARLEMKQDGRACFDASEFVALGCAGAEFMGHGQTFAIAMIKWKTKQHVGIVGIVGVVPTTKRTSA